MSSLDHPLARAALREVVELHAFFEAWLGGTAPATDLTFQRLESALAETFSMVAPNGHRMGRAEVLLRLRRAHGGRPPPFRIAIHDPQAIFVAPPVVVLGYVEEQEAGEALTRRRSTAVLAAADPSERPLWLALHETWIDPER